MNFFKIPQIVLPLLIFYLFLIYMHVRRDDILLDVFFDNLFGCKHTLDT